MNISKLKDCIADVIGAENIKENARMAEYSSFKAGGQADLLVIPEDRDQLCYLLYLLGGVGDCAGGCGCGRANTCASGCGGCGGHASAYAGDCREILPYMIIGNGSNILVRDGGYKGVLIKLGGAFDRVEVRGESIVAGAAALLSQVARAALEASLTGFEFASGIPGSVGGGVFMNAGAYGGELKDCIDSVVFVSRDGMTESLKYTHELEFGYRHSIFGDTGDIITEVTFKLQKGDRTQIADRIKELATKRNTKQPMHLPSAGSFFKRPAGNFAGTLIEGAGLKGLSVGDAQVSPLHAGFIVNNGAATASDIIALMKLVQYTVYDKEGVMLEPEVRIIGETE